MWFTLADKMDSEKQDKIDMPVVYKPTMWSKLSSKLNAECFTPNTKSGRFIVSCQGLVQLGGEVWGFPR